MKYHKHLFLFKSCGKKEKKIFFFTLMSHQLKQTTMQTFIFQKKETLIEVEAMAKLMAIESKKIDYEPYLINYEDVKGLTYRDTYKEIEPFDNELNGTLFFRTETNGTITKLFLIA